MSDHPKQTYIHRVDQADRICFVNDAWTDFADENGAPGLGDHVIGTPIWDYLTGEEVQSTYRAIVKDIRDNQRKQPFTIPYRCDSPGLKRELQMEIRLLENGAIEFRSTLEKEVSRAPAPLIDAKVPRSQSSIKLCAWCRRVRYGAQWLELEEALEILQPFLQQPLPRITHGICPECRHRLQSK